MAGKLKFFLWFAKNKKYLIPGLVLVGAAAVYVQFFR